MKSNKFWSVFILLVIMLGSAVVFSSCGDDEGLDDPSASGNSFVGLYKAAPILCGGCNAKTHFGVIRLTKDEYYEYCLDTKKSSCPVGFSKSFPYKSGYYYDGYESGRTITVVGNYIRVAGTGFILQINGNKLTNLETGDVYTKW